MLVIRDEKLATIGVGTAVGHGHNATLGVLEGVSDLIRKLAVGSWEYAFASFASSCRITSLPQVYLTVSNPDKHLLLIFLCCSYSPAVLSMYTCLVGVQSVDQQQGINM